VLGGFGVGKGFRGRFGFRVCLRGGVWGIGMVFGGREGWVL
jgi:hypothetical protein